MPELYDMAVVGCGTMGGNLALNIEDKGFAVVGYDLDRTKVAKLLHDTQGRRIIGSANVAEMAGALVRPRKILLMVPAGAPVDAAIESLLPHLEPGDIIIDGGNSYFKDTIARIGRVEKAGILFIGLGVSGGEEGALKGPSLMPGGSAQAWSEVQPILEKIAAKAPDGAPCCRWMGQGGAGHFVKMIHNGIEYADMQLIAESYSILRGPLAMEAGELSETFLRWNTGELESYLIGITGQLLLKKDPAAGRPMVEMILDRARQKGTGAWAVQSALELGVAIPAIAEAVFARYLSALKDERIQAARIFGRPPVLEPMQDRPQWIEGARQALYIAKICAYAQGFALLQTASKVYDWNLNLHDVAAIWRAGCIIRAGFLDRLKDAFAADPALPNILQDPTFCGVIKRYEAGLRGIVSAGILNGLALPAHASAVNYLDAYRTETLPANLIQAQRDYFGAHMFERTDKPGQFHALWDELPDL